MADLFYPQLKTGSIAHYPIRKVAVTRTVSNVLPDGTVLMFPDDAAGRRTWSWEYVGLTLEDAASLQDFFEACNGPLKPFTFLDPTGNLLSASSNFRAPAWQLSSAITAAEDVVASPLATASAVTLVNKGQALQELAQTLPVPSDYAYSFSMYVSSPAAQSVTVFRRSVNAEETASVDAGPNWKRVWTSGNLQDRGTSLSVGIKLSPGQQLSISAAQLQAQPSVSAYRDRPQSGDIYPNAHWAIEELTVRHLSPNVCSISVAIEA